MTHFLSKTLITSVAVLIAAYLLKGVYVSNIASAMLVAVVLGLMNNFVKPILILLTIPITIITLGLYLLVINVIIIKWVAAIVPGFYVSGWFSALFFSIIVSVVTSFLESVIRKGE